MGRVFPLHVVTTTSQSTETPPPGESLQAGVFGPLQLFTGEFLTYALVFFVLAIVAALVGFRGVAGISMEIARILVLLFIVLAVISLIL